MFRSVDVDVVEVDGFQDVVGVVGFAAQHGVQVKDQRFSATFFPAHLTLRTLIVGNILR